ncbi:phospholipase D/Transphosphatidylase [Pseudopedobacter saltans DSM 12145]|uniref:Cardiolipin synthase n=1 Tax=Pseudopedobacter saltans (strain ATCC 51119 / DSM 12145 / JCM 21818 / CCUG 39354 / LMG 10337 / NBRC 100064 / NCIMB 13643) TaxID=762903 RepID=F0SEL0_PSESL|nr:cardiolipin synthase [Pseudopedobacter saltans]ADY51900.1 phospholipase D/Transphosphatidylase [Pseudopedobacter saltans DSM 12145]
MPQIPYQTTLILIGEVAYIVILIGVCLKIIYDTRSSSKTVAYLLLVIFIPIIGIIFYFSFGINYRKSKIYNKKLEIDESLKEVFKRRLIDLYQYFSTSKNPSLLNNQELTRLMANKKNGNEGVLPNNVVEPLFNGEILFPKLITELKKAKKHIHFEYYIYENDFIGNEIKNILIEKAKEGVEVRFIYDDFGSSGIRKNIIRELKRNGVQAFPFNKIKLIYFANRINYRNHRKIVIIDGITSFIGGINISDRYINSSSDQLYWKDAHLMIKGYSTLSLQQIFLADWNFCSKENLMVNKDYFPPIEIDREHSIPVQITSSGPDSELPSILFAIVQAVNLARREILLTTPYYVPDQTLQDSLVIAALSGIDVKLLIPKKGDSLSVSVAAQSYFEELLEAGVKIYQYEKGFIHAKTIVTDREMASVGTANLDSRSFDLNFEVAALIYDSKIAYKLAIEFENDLKHSTQIDLYDWNKRNKARKLIERIFRLLSPFM